MKCWCSGWEDKELFMASVCTELKYDEIHSTINNLTVLWAKKCNNNHWKR